MLVNKQNFFILQSSSSRCVYHLKVRISHQEENVSSPDGDETLMVRKINTNINTQTSTHRHSWGVCQTEVGVVSKVSCKKDNMLTCLSLSPPVCLSHSLHLSVSLSTSIFPPVSFFIYLSVSLRFSPWRSPAGWGSSSGSGSVSALVTWVQHHLQHAVRWIPRGRSRLLSGNHSPGLTRIYLVLIDREQVIVNIQTCVWGVVMSSLTRTGNQNDVFPHIVTGRLWRSTDVSGRRTLDCHWSVSLFHSHTLTHTQTQPYRLCTHYLLK